MLQNQVIYVADCNKYSIVPVLYTIPYLFNLIVIEIPWISNL